MMLVSAVPGELRTVPRHEPDLVGPAYRPPGCESRPRTLQGPATEAARGASGRARAARFHEPARQTRQGPRRRLRLWAVCRRGPLFGPRGADHAFGDRLGLALERLARLADPEFATRLGDIAAQRLGDVCQLVREQLLSTLRIRRKRAFREVDVLAHGEGVGVHRARRFHGDRVSVHAHARQRDAERALHLTAQLLGERLPAADARQRVLDRWVFRPRIVRARSRLAIQRGGSPLGHSP